MISLRPLSIDFSESWRNNCQKQLQSLFQDNSEEVAPISAIKLYSNIYELCISFPENHTMPLLKNIAQLFFDSAVEIRKNIMGLQAGAMSDETILNLYVKEWGRYCTAYKGINGVCRYLNKCLASNYETAQYPASPTDVDSSSPGLHFQPVLVQLGHGKSERVEIKVKKIEDVAKSVWNSLILRYFREKEDNILIKNFLIALRREQINQEDLKSFIESYRWCDDLSLLEMVEADSKEYYARLSREYIKNKSTSEYVIFASEQLSREALMTKYLWSSNPSAIPIIMRVCELELIDNHKMELQEEFERMLQSNRTTDVNGLFKLLGKNDGTMLALQNSLNQLVLKDFDVLYDPLNSSQAILLNVFSVFKKHLMFIKSAFDDDERMLETLEDSMAQIINQKIKKSCSLFSNFIDEILKKKLSITKDISSLMKLFTSRTESFESFINDYKEKLAERCVFNVPEVLAEESVLDLFNEKISAEQNCHLKRILNDYKERNESKSVLVLTSHAWPQTCNPPLSINLEVMPNSLKTIMSSFESEYREEHCGRKLQWCPQLITLEAENGTTMSLLQYQIIDALPLKSSEATDLAVKLGVSLNDFTAALKVLQESKVIKIDTNFGTFEFDSLPSNLNLIPIKGVAVDEPEIASSLAHILIGQDGEKLTLEFDSSRQVRQSFILQSLITLILKRQRQVSPAELKKLLLKSTSELKNDHSFVPVVEEIDAAVDGLIGKGYLEFNESENLFIYVP